jgi:inner membrane protein
MSPVTHLFASWIIASKTTNNLRDRRMVALAGCLPDLDGLGLVVDLLTRDGQAGGTFLYQEHHHYLLHGLFGAVLVALVASAFAQQKLRVLCLSLLVFHVHLLCDFVGSRGPSPSDLWPIHYLGPFSRTPLWVWRGQWELIGWPNRALTVLLYGWVLYLAVRQGDSFVGVFSRRLDAVFVGVLRKWTRWNPAPGPG